jgi:hypothetical protein
LPLVLGLIGLFKKGSLVEKNIFRDKKKIGVRSALSSRCHKKGFSSVVYRIFTFAVGSRAHRSFSKRSSAEEKKFFFLGGGGTARFQISFSMAEIVQKGVNHNI